ncbi:MAG: DUF4352 domain-containing protein [Angustibacter sp.]
MSESFIDQESGRPYAIDPATGNTYWLDEYPAADTAPAAHPTPAPTAKFPVDEPSPNGPGPVGGLPPAQPEPFAAAGGHGGTFGQSATHPAEQPPAARYGALDYAQLPSARADEEAAPSKWLLVAAAGIAVVMFIVGFTSGRITGGSKDDGGKAAAEGSASAVTQQSELEEEVIEINKTGNLQKLKIDVKRITTGVAAVKIDSTDGVPAGQFTIVEMTITNTDKLDASLFPDYQQIITDAGKTFDGSKAAFNSLNGDFKYRVLKGKSLTLKYPFDIPLGARPAKLSLSLSGFRPQDEVVIEIPAS